MSWTNGYISDVSYPAFFYKEMQPLWLSTVAGFSGLSAPDMSKSFALCELGCGVGINLLIAAACHPDSHFVGIDFNGDNLRVARDAATSSGIANVEFIQSDFAAFAQGNSGPFDFMTCHGVWSWIAPLDRAVLLDCASRSLNADGLFYLHYMCHPGSTDMAPLQHLLNLCAHHMPGPSARKAQVGMKLLQQAARSGLFADKPETLRHLNNMAKRDPADLAHEFLTDHWQPQHSVDLHQQLGTAGLSFVGSADIFNNLDISLSIPGNMQGLVRQTRIPALAEALKDMARGAHQRTDLFQKDPAALDPKDVSAGIEDMRFFLLPRAPRCGPITFSTPIGPVTGPEAIFTPLLERLSTGPATGADLLRLPPFAGDFGALLQSLQLLMMQGMAHPAVQVVSSGDDRVRNLSRWFERYGIALAIVEAGATAVEKAAAG